MVVLEDTVHSASEAFGSKDSGVKAMTVRLLAALLSIPAAGCALGQSGADLKSVSRGSDLALTADYRMVYKRDRADGKVFCAEPSPDIGRIVSAASSGSFTGSAKGLANVQPELALAFAASRAEGLAQLGQRLATIQLLRDSTYRACEAYANEAISAATYAMIVSRYDDVMVTLLLGEMAASASRPTGSALLTGQAAIGGLGQATGEGAVKMTMGRMEKATAGFDAAVAARGRLKADAPEADRTAAQQAVALAQKEFDEASLLLKAALNAVGGSSVSTGATVVNGVPEMAGTQIAQQLAGMQKVYLSDFNLDAVMVGCLSALSQLDWPERSLVTRRLEDAAAPTTQVASSPVRTGDAPIVRAEPVPQGPGVQAGTGAASFLSTAAGGSYSLQDECRAVLLNGQTLRAVAKARLDQVAAEAANGK